MPDSCWPRCAATGGCVGATRMAERRWRATLARLAPTAAKAPLAFGRLLAALDFVLGRTVELAVIGKLDDPTMAGFLDVIRERFLPNRLVAVAAPDSASGTMPLLADRRAIDG